MRRRQPLIAYLSRPNQRKRLPLSDLFLMEFPFLAFGFTRCSATRKLGRSELEFPPESRLLETYVTDLAETFCAQICDGGTKATACRSALFACCGVIPNLSCPKGVLQIVVEAQLVPERLYQPIDKIGLY